MLQLREILVTTDLSEHSASAFTWARELADATGAKITLLTIVEFPSQLSYVAVEAPGVIIDAPFQEMLNQMKVQAKESLANLAKRLGSRCQDLLVVEGSPAAREILRVAAERKSDLIIISTHGRTGLARFALGSTAERVVREAPCPVLTVRATVEGGGKG